MSSSSDRKPFFERGSIVAGWTVIRRIGSGGFGTVYEVEKDGKRAAMKTEYIFEDKSEALRNEVKHLRLLKFSQHFCHLFLACKCSYGNDLINIMVMTLVGRSLSAYRRLMPESKFTKNTAVRLCSQALEAISDLHSIGVIHRDIKASNFAWHPEQRLVYLLDLGFCRRFMQVEENGTVTYRKPRKGLSFMGTTKYCSINVHNRQEQSRRDDLWSWLYMFVEFVSGKLVWSERGEHMQYRIKETLGTKLVAKCPVEMVYIYDHISVLEFFSKPDYEYLQRKMAKYLKARKVELSTPYDWEEGGCHYEHIKKKETNVAVPLVDLALQMVKEEYQLKNSSSFFSTEKETNCETTETNS